MGAELIAWTVRLGMVCLAIVLAGWASGTSSPGADRGLRLIWTVGWGLMLGHFLAAFHFQHGWSHAHAVAETARQTREQIGWEFGGGVYFNYLFLAAWGGDVVLWWLGQERAAWYRPVRYILLSYLVLIALNGVIVFKAGWVRWVGVATSLLLLAIWWNRSRGQRVI